MQNNKRERCLNWEKEEKQLFRNILRPYLSIIENKDLSTNTNKEKMKAWSEITVQFNLANVRTRDKKQLMNQWKCLKLASKKELSSYRRELTKTGGGQKPPSPSPDTIEVAEMIPLEFEIDFNQFDCDGVRDTADEIVVETIEIQHPKNNIESIKDKDFPKPESKPDAVITPKRTKTPKASNNNNLAEASYAESKPDAVITPKRTKTSKASKEFNFTEASYADMHSFRVLENERLQKEHQLRIKCLENMAEIQSQVMKNLKLQTEILQKSLESANKNN